TAAGSIGLAPAARLGLDAALGTVAYRLSAGDPAPARGSAHAGGNDAASPATVGAGTRSGSAGGDVVAGAATVTTAAARLTAAAATAPLAAAGPSINKQALAAIGQPDLLSSILNQPAAPSLFYPYDVVRDRSVSQTRFYVADALNSRVLGVECAGSNCALATFTSATRVFGQPDFGSFQQHGGVLGGVR